MNSAAAGPLSTISAISPMSCDMGLRPWIQISIFTYRVRNPPSRQLPKNLEELQNSPPGPRPQNQESSRQTKPKKGKFMNFSRGQIGTKVRCESCLFYQGKTPEFTKMGEIHELLVLALSLVWFAGATPDQKKGKSLKTPKIVLSGYFLHFFSACPHLARRGLS